MGNVDHVSAALARQGILENSEIPISVYSSEKIDNANGSDLGDFYIQNGIVVPQQPGAVLVVCGAAAFKRYQGSAVKKNVGVEKTRGMYVPFGVAPGSWFTSSYSPDTAYPDFVSGFRADAAVAYRVARTGVVEPELPVPVVGCRSVQDILYDLETRPHLGGLTLSLDLETMGLDPYKVGAEIVAVSLTWIRAGVDTPYCDVIYTLGYSALEWALLADGLNEILNHDLVNVIGANLKYDLAWLATKGITCKHFVFDTLLGGSLVDENRWNGLNQHAKTYTDFGGYDDGFNNEFDKGHMETVPKKNVVNYAGGDTQACYYSAKKILGELKDVSRGPDGLIQKRTPYNFYNAILHPAARAFERVEQRGMYVDLEKFNEFGQWAKTQICKFELQLSSQLPNVIKARHEEWGKFTPALVADYLFNHLGIEPLQFTAKSGKPSTAWTHLQAFQDHPAAGEFVTALKEFNAVKKIHSTYFVGWLKHLRDDGLFHPTYWLHRAGMGGEGGAVTGRSSVTDPALQTLPKHTEMAKRLRKCFIAPHGYYVAGLDYSQGELRIVACIANEKVMLKVYADGGDLHSVTAANMLAMDLAEFMAKADKDPVWFEAARRNGKAGNFGLVYGMGAEGFVNYAWATYGVKLTIEEATGQRDTFFETYPALTNYHQVQTNTVKQHQQVISPLGRVRHLPHIASSDKMASGLARRQAINSPIQSTLADMSFWSIAQLHEHFPEIWVWGNIHDQNLLYVPIDGWEDQIGQAKEVMENLPFEEIFGWKPQLKFPTDALVGPNLGELYDVDKFDG